MILHSNKWIKTVCYVCTCASLLFARVEINVNNPDIKMGISSLGWVESGQMVRFYNLDVELDHNWINHTFLDLCVDAVYKERLKLAFGVEGELWFNVPKQRGTGQATYVHEENSTFKIMEADASYMFGDVNSPYLSITAGLFPYKYNPEARNLGEYLFRSGTYPAYLINNFDRAYARLTGFKVSSNLFEGSLHQDLIYSIETEIPPFYDGSLSYLIGGNFKKIVDMTAGVSFAHLVAVDERVTTPKTNKLGSKNQIIYAPGDTGYYTFRGTKLMSRLTFDPQAILSLLGKKTTFLGPEDLKIYGEALILGVKSYPANDSINPMSGSRRPGYNTWGYDSLKNKMPLIVGFNWPTHPLLSYTIAPALLTFGLRDKDKIDAADFFNPAVLTATVTGALSGVGLWLLEKNFHFRTGLDVLALEMEWYNCNYPNSFKNRLGPGYNISYPVPDDPARTSVNYATTDNLKLSLYAKKTFFNDRLGIILQIARDHIRNVTLVNESFDYEETLSKKSQYWWMLKFQAAF